MKNKKGFTLIELLAVIIMLAIIALIAVPIVMNIINKSKKSAAESSTYGYVKAVENALATYMLDNPGIFYDKNEYIVGSEDLNIEVKGNIPTIGKVCLANNVVTSGIFEVSGYIIKYDGKIAKVTTDYTKNDIQTFNCNEGKDNIDAIVEVKFGTKDAIGSIYTLKNKNGEESYWYVIDSDNDTVTLFSKYNLSSASNYLTQDKSGAINPVAFDESNARTKEDNTYCVSPGASTTTLDYGCHIYGTMDSFQLGNFSGKITQDSSIKKLVDTYVSTLDLGSSLIDKRLITLDELISLGCSNDTCGNHRFKWLYSSSYWTMTPKEDSNYTMWSYGVYNDSGVIGYGPTTNNSDYFGVRPVIKISKKYITSTSIGGNKLSSIATVSTDLGVTSIDTCATNGTCDFGTAFAIKVNNTETYKFYVIGDTGSNVTLIMANNYDMGNINNNHVYWSDSNSSLFQPTVALEAVKTYTNGWSNIPSMNYILQDEGGKYNPITIENVKARLLTYSEAIVVGCDEYNHKCPSYLTESGENDYGYWLSSTSLDNYSEAYYINVKEGGSHLALYKTGNTNMYGIRPVITISK